MGARILVVEDNPDNMKLIEYLLRAHGYQPILALGGEEGIALARAERPDLILMDLQMPGIDGFRATAAIRQTAPQQRIVAVTAFAMVGDRDRVVSAGFDGYITKPLDPTSFIDQVNAYLPAVKTEPSRDVRTPR